MALQNTKNNENSHKSTDDTIWKTKDCISNTNLAKTVTSGASERVGQFCSVYNNIYVFYGQSLNNETKDKDTGYPEAIQ